jgi:hypothetical protein
LDCQGKSLNLFVETTNINGKILKEQRLIIIERGSEQLVAALFDKCQLLGIELTANNGQNAYGFFPQLLLY